MAIREEARDTVAPRGVRGVLGMLTALLALALSAVPAAAKGGSYLAGDRSLADDYTAIEGAKLGVVLPGGPEHFFEVKESSKSALSTPTGPAMGRTDCSDSMGGQTGPPVRCVLEFAVVPHKNGELRATVAHEVFHGFQAAMSGTLANYAREEAQEGWLVEGSATWVESDLINKDRIAREAWTKYLRSPAKRPLLSRSYDAVGFFGHMASTGISPWRHFEAMFAATASPAAYAAGVGGNLSFLDSEASVFFREPGFGSAWDAQGPNVPSRAAVGFHPTSVTITKSTPPLTLKAKPYADAADELSISGLPRTKPVVELTVESGYVRLRSTAGGRVNAVNPRQVLLCTDPKGCKCPNRPNHYERFERGDLAITGGPSGGEVMLVRRAPCEVLLPQVPCETLLPGFSQVPINSVTVPLLGTPASAQVTRPHGSSGSSCGLLTKGRESTNAVGESVFVGALAPLVFVLRASSIEGAAKYYALASSVTPPHLLVSHPEGVGEESTLLTGSEDRAGEVTYVSSGIVRVQNLVAQFALISSGGSTEADPSESLRLLKVVASRL
jgi:hypothetical protein